MDTITAGVLDTLMADAASNDLAREAARVILTAAMTWEELERLPHRLDRMIGTQIATTIGERLSVRFRGAVPADQTHDLLWMTFMGAVDWPVIGFHFRDGMLPAGWVADNR